MAVIAIGSKGKVNANSVNVRKDAGTSYDRVYYAQSGDIVTVQAHKNGPDGKVWLKITNETRYTSKVGWIRNDFVDPYSETGDAGGTDSDNVPSAYSIPTVVDTTWNGGGILNLRKSASVGASVLAQIPNGASVWINTNSGTWVKVWYEGTEGYAMAKFIRGTEAYAAENAAGDSNSGDSGSTNTVFHAGHMLSVASATVNVRGSASTSGAWLGVLKQGTKVYCTQVVSDSWVQIYWGGQQQDYAYIKSEFLADDGVAPESRIDRAVAIANSMKNKNYPHNNNYNLLGFTAEEWCVQYVTWLLKAVGCTDYPSASNVSGLIDHYSETGRNAAYKFMEKEYKIPEKGDIVVYTTTNSTPAEPKKYYAHVGFVVKREGNNITTVEGNLGDTITSPGTYNYLTEKDVGNRGNHYSVLGFATPNWDA